VDSALAVASLLPSGRTISLTAIAVTVIFTRFGVASIMSRISRLAESGSSIEDLSKVSCRASLFHQVGTRRRQHEAWTQ
jgi:hypothetical protein